MNTEAVLKLINSPTKTHNDHHNGDLQIPVFGLPVYHQVSSIMINHPSNIHLIISLILTLLQCSSLKTFSIMLKLHEQIRFI